MTRVKNKPLHNGQPRLGGSTATSASPRAPRGSAPSADHPLDEVESVARIGSYSLDIPAGRWVSSKGLDAIFGIDARFERSVEGWASLVHPADREAMVAYYTDEVLGHGQPFDRQYRIVRADTGEERWVHGRGTLGLDEHGRPLRLFGTIADITEHRSAQDALIRSELRYAAIFEGTAEAILIAEVATQRIRWANPAACALLGYTKDELLGMSVHDIHPASELPTVLDQFRATADGRVSEATSVPCVRRDGSVLLANIRGSAAVVDGVKCNIGFFTDVTELRRLEIRDRQLAQAIDQTSEAILITGPTGEIEYTNPAFRDLSGLQHDESISGNASAFGGLQSPEATEAVQRAISAGASWSGDGVIRCRDGTERIAEASISPVHDAGGTMTGLVTVVRDVTDERALATERERLAAAVEQSSDSVIIADLAGTIQYVNPAFERVSGYRRDEAVGQNPRILKSGIQSAAFYRALWRRLSRGQTWTGTLVNRHKDGSLFEEEATISPIRGPGGEITGYVAVKRDVTALRAAESGLARESRERAEVAAALARLQPGPSAEETAADICDRLLGLPGIDVAAIVSFLDPRRAVTLALSRSDDMLSGPDDLPSAPGRPLPVARAAYLYERAAQGPWAEGWRPRLADGQYGETVAESGIRAIAYAPIRTGDGLLGVVAAGTRDEAYARHLVDHLPAVGEFAATAGALLGGQLERGHRDARVRDRIQRVLAERGFSPLFQPIVALASGEPVGYEALTRFADGTPPDRMIADAHSVGLGLDLEIACLKAALEAAESMPRHTWLSLNVSPETILRSKELAGLVAHRSSPIVIELTEHAVVDDYPAVRHAIKGLRPTVRLAVDDAGAGFASLRHVVELKPDFLKLDIGLVHRVDRDVTRQAMIAGLKHFAARVGCEVIAEGIERPTELKMLRELGVPLAQGYLFGLPEPLPAASGSARRPGPARTGRWPLVERTGASSPRSPLRDTSGPSSWTSRLRGGGPHQLPRSR